jgi:AAA domain, putative AbiEii toxin, Type IV TA system/AAA domain
MEPVIRRLTLRGFRSVRAESVEFDNPTILLGLNGSGKSNLADALALLGEVTATPLAEVLDRRGGDTIRHRAAGGKGVRHVGLAAELGTLADGQTGRYAFVLRFRKGQGFRVVREQCVVQGPDGTRHWFDRRGQALKSNVQGLTPLLGPMALALPVIGGEARLAPVLGTLAGIRTCAIQPTLLREPHAGNGATLRPDGGNAAAVLWTLGRRAPSELERIGELLETVAPHTRTVRPWRQGGRYGLRFVQEWGAGERLTLDAARMSDGTLRALGILAAVYQRPTPRVLVIEEPEATMHVEALGGVTDILRHAGRFMQVVVTTHSPEVLEAEWVEDRHLRVVSWEGGMTRVAPVSRGTQEALQEHLMSAGGLLRANALRAAPLAASSVRGRLFEEVGT